MNNVLNTIKNLGELSNVIGDKSLSIYDLAAIASLFNGGVDEALSTLDEDNFYHGNVASVAVVDEDDIEEYEVYNMVFDWYAHCIVDYRLYLEDNGFRGNFQQFSKCDRSNAIVTVKNHLMLEYKNMRNYIADMETCINIVAANFLNDSKPLYTINLTNQGGKAFILMRSQTI